jgi:hypothetical protein
MQTLEVFYSPNDIPSGAPWVDEIRKNLQGQVFGIVCVTRQNLNEPWLLFESGAISNAVGDQSRLCPFLFDIDSKAIGPPLSIFQWRSSTKADVTKLVHDINKARDDGKLTEAKLNVVIEKYWPDLSHALDALQGRIASGEFGAIEPAKSRSVEQMLEELLDLARADYRTRHLSGFVSFGDSVYSGLGSTFPGLVTIAGAPPNMITLSASEPKHKSPSITADGPPLAATSAAPVSASVQVAPAKAADKAPAADNANDGGPRSKKPDK